MFLEISSIFRLKFKWTVSLTFGYPTDRQIGRDTNFMAESAGQTHIRCCYIFYLGFLIYIQKYRDKTAKNCRLLLNLIQ